MLSHTQACAPTRQLETTTATVVMMTSVRTTTIQPTTTTAPTTSTTSITTTTPPVCSAPNSNSVGLTIDQVSGESGAATQEATNHCASCIQSSRNFYTSATSSDADDAISNGEVALIVRCASTQLCICNTQNACCTPPTDAAAPAQVNFIPYCDNTGCIMKAVLGTTPMVTQLQCENGQTYTFERQVDMNGNLLPLNSGAYFAADRTSCRGCDNIRTNSCIGALENGPA
ncbi:hypothetical protein M3Y96_00587600 [Aphelenchoides besseyi]|nr:hypothetical protein M3Y96_00587600 [Aphelenchoides besseyi]